MKMVIDLSNDGNTLVGPILTPLLEKSIPTQSPSLEK